MTRRILFVDDEPAVLDGLRNVLPSGAPLALYQHSSCLVDAYKRTDVDPETRLGIFSLTARVSDRPEPAEELRATTVWCHGLAGFEVALSAAAIDAFRRGERPAPERVLTGRRGNYLVTATLALEPGERAEWHLVADTGRSHVQIAALRARLLESRDAGRWIADALAEAGRNLRRIVASADGIQLTRRPEVSAHHFANVLFNGLRGGVFAKHHALPGRDFAQFVRARDRALAARHAAFLAGLPEELDVSELHRATAATGDADLRRLGLEYLPLYFGRRHGDPSRPWNRFSIDVRNPDGSQALRYEGNWRDVFQNWEALTRSFPGFLPGVIATFVNASTVDGFNPYRITRDGFDWEVLEPGSPWSGIGYWATTRSSTCCACSSRCTPTPRAGSRRCSASRSSATRTCRTGSYRTRASSPIPGARSATTTPGRPTSPRARRSKATTSVSSAPPTGPSSAPACWRSCSCPRSRRSPASCPMAGSG